MQIFAQVMPLVDGLVNNNLTDIDIDYGSLGVHFSEMIQSITAMQNFSGPYFPEILSGFNMTANNFRYQAAFEKFIRQDASQ